MTLVLFVEDIDVAENRIHIQDRGPLENGAEIKTVHAQRSIDISSDLINELVAYVGKVHTVEIETNHLFLKLHGQRRGHPLTYADFCNPVHPYSRAMFLSPSTQDKTRQAHRTRDTPSHTTE
ncbi:MAG TPA: hypothetical protein VGN34_31295 [Ktedonobacteraceae bacterium]